MIPALKSTGVADYLTDRYVRIDSNAVIAALADEGYTVQSARQDLVRQRDPRFARHELAFTHPDMGSKALDDGTTARVLFINSYNGTARAQFLLGMFRFICSNGVIVGSAWAHERVLHVGDGAKQIVERIKEASKGTGQMFAAAEAMSRKQLTKSQQQDMAREAMKLRFGDDGAERYDPNQLLVPLRAQDEGDSLWRVFNRIQEHGTRTKMIGMSTSGRRLTSRGINNITADHNWNKQLWELAESFTN
jgi:hypothetical protein